MSKFSIAYPSNGQDHNFPAKNLEEMTLEEVVQKHIRTCGKANGNVATCSQCKSPCKEGKRAIQLLANKVYSDPPIPLYGGKTLIEKAREENMKRRTQSGVSALAKALEDAKNEQLNNDKPLKKKKKIRWEGWWEESLASGDQMTWVMEKMGISKTQAKRKIYQYMYSHGMIAESKPAKAEPKQEKQEEKPVQETKQEAPSDKTIENKLEKLLKLQEEHKKAMAEYMHLYEEAKKEYEKIKQKTDILCSAMDIMNDI